MTNAEKAEQREFLLWAKQIEVRDGGERSARWWYYVDRLAALNKVETEEVAA